MKNRTLFFNLSSFLSCLFFVFLAAFSMSVRAQSEWQTAGLREFVDSKYDSAFLVPESFKEVKGEGKYRFESPDGGSYITYEVMTTVQGGGNNYADAEAMVRYVAKTMQQQFEAEIITLQKVKADDFKGWMVEFVWKMDGAPIKQREIGLDIGNHIYSFGYVSAETLYDKYLDFFKAAVSSLTLEDSNKVAVSKQKSAAEEKNDFLIVEVDKKPVSGNLSTDTQIILLRSDAAGTHKFKLATADRVPAVVILHDKEGNRLTSNIVDGNAVSSFEYNLTANTTYIIGAVVTSQDYRGKSFSLAVKKIKEQDMEEVISENKGIDASETSLADVEKPYTSTELSGPVLLEQGIEIGGEGVEYTAYYDAKGRLKLLDDQQGGVVIVECRRQGEPSGVDVWQADGTYTSYNFGEESNEVIQGKFGEAVDAVMNFDRTTGKQTAKLKDGTTVVADLNEDGAMDVDVITAGGRTLTSRSSIKNTEKVELDDEHRVKKIDFAGRNLAAFKYNDKGQLERLTLDSGAEIINEYDQRGRLKKVIDPYGNAAQISYKDGGDVIIEEGPGGFKIKRVLDDRGREIQVNGPGKRQKSYTYAGDDLVQVELVDLDKQVYVPFDDGNISPVASSLTGDWLFQKIDSDAFDKIRRIDPFARETVYKLTLDGQVESVKDKDGKGLVTVKYNSSGLPAYMETPERFLIYMYDSSNNNRLTVERYGKDIEINLQYHYNENGVVDELRELRHSPVRKSKIEYESDIDGRLVAITNSEAGDFNLKYGIFGLPVKLDRPNGVTTLWKYDEGGRVTECRHKKNGDVMAYEKYAYTPEGRVKTVDKSGVGVTEFDYDENLHLKHLKTPEKEKVVNYDMWGNPLQYHKLVFAYSDNHHLQKLSSLDGRVAIPVKCDEIGRIIDFGSDQVGGKYIASYDWNHRLKSLKAPARQEEYFWNYDARGRVGSLIERKAGDVNTEKYLYAFDQLYAVQKNDDQFERYIMIPGRNECVAVIKADGKIYYPLWDKNGSITHLTDEAGKIVYQREFKSYGGVRSGGKDMPVALGFRNGLLFTGGSVLFLDNRAYFVDMQRAAAAVSPEPQEAPLRNLNPFLLPGIEREF